MFVLYVGKEREDKSRIPKIHSKWSRNEQGGGEDRVG